MSKQVTTKPHVIIEITRENGTIRVTKATLYRNILPPVKLSTRRATQLVNDCNEEIFEVLGNNRYLIRDKRFIAKLGNGQVKHINKYIGPVVAIALSFTILTNTYDASENKLNNEFEKSDSRNIESSQNLEETAKDFKKAIIQSQTIVTPNIVDEILEQKTLSQTISFDYKDRTAEDSYNYTVENYSDSIKNYTEVYGEDAQLITALISQENPFNKPNNTEKGARGVTQIESVWWGNTITAYRFDTKEKETVTIDGNRLNSDPDYAIKIGCMIFNFNYHDIYHNYVETKILTPQEGIEAAIFAYNKGLYGIKNLIDKYGADYINHVDELRGGDNEYTNHIFSYIKDGTMIVLLNKDETVSIAYIDNTNVETFTK